MFVPYSITSLSPFLTLSQ